MNCKNCNSELPQGAKFCANCGSSVEELISDNNVVVEESPAKAVEEVPAEVFAEVPAEPVVETDVLPVESADDAPSESVVETLEVSAEPVMNAVEASAFASVIADSVADSVAESVAESPISESSGEIDNSTEGTVGQAYEEPIVSEEIAEVPTVEQVDEEPMVAVTASTMAAATSTVIPETPVAPVETISKNEDKKPSRKAVKDKKRYEKQAKVQEVIDSIPVEYKPVSTSTYFWLGLLSSLPVIGFIFTIILSIVGFNKNRKNFERAILAMYIILIVISLAGGLVLTFIIPDVLADVYYSIADLIIDFF